MAPVRRKEAAPPQPGDPDAKICSHCKTIKPITEFYLIHSSTGKVQRNSWCRDCMCEQTTANTRRLRQEVIAAYGGRCRCCGEDRWQFLSVDHVGGGGNEHRRRVTGRSNGNFYHWLRRHGFPRRGFQLLCHNCNQAAGHYGECPHQTERRMRRRLKVL